jgi:hypothetical protein
VIYAIIMILKSPFSETLVALIRHIFKIYDAQYAIFGGKFFGAKNDDLSEFPIT